MTSVPTGGPHDNSLEVVGEVLVVGLESIRGCKIDYHALLCKCRVDGAHILCCGSDFDAVLEEYSFYHMAHSAISANYCFHIS